MPDKLRKKSNKLSKIGLITGTGLDADFFSVPSKKEKIKTAFGCVVIQKLKLKNKEIFWLKRHTDKYCSPAQINYHANLAALNKCGIESLIATSAVGSLSKRLGPGEMVLLDDFIDLTKTRQQTFTPDAYIDLSQPYDLKLKKQILTSAQKLGLRIKARAVYACVEGPRFETKAEIKMMAKLGADVVGMTQVPEVVLANEIGLPYAAIAVVTNYAAGLTKQKISAFDVFALMKKKQKILIKLIKNL